MAYKIEVCKFAKEENISIPTRLPILIRFNCMLLLDYTINTYIENNTLYADVSLPVADYLKTYGYVLTASYKLIGNKTKNVIAIGAVPKTSGM